MAKGREPGKKNRTTPPLPLSGALAVAEGIGDQASGMKVSKLTLAEILGTTPTSSTFRDLVAASRLYGLTVGGINAQEYELTAAGAAVTSGDPAAREAALKAAVMTIPAYKTSFDTFVSKKVPAPGPFREFLTRDAGVAAEYVEEVMINILDDAKTAGLIRVIGGAEWIDLTGTPAPPKSHGEGTGADATTDGSSGEDGDAREDVEDVIVLNDSPKPPVDATKKKRPNRLFIGHGKSKKPLDQLTKMLRDLTIPHLVAEEEPNVGRPISKKVRDTMDACGAAILIFSADVEYFDKDSNSVWRPSENVAHELGAAAVLYDDRIIIFKEESVTLASNFSGLVYISFQKDNLSAKLDELLRELVALKILRIAVDADDA